MYRISCKTIRRASVKSTIIFPAIIDTTIIVITIIIVTTFLDRRIVGRLLHIRPPPRENFSNTLTGLYTRTT